MIEAFCRRLRTAMAWTKTSQTTLAAMTGEFSVHVVNRLSRGSAQTVPIDLMVGIAKWAKEKGISLGWLLTGQGEMLTKGQEDD